MVRMIPSFPSKDFKARIKAIKKTRRWNRNRDWALYRATLGEHIPRLEREEYDLPDWTA